MMQKAIIALFLFIGLLPSVAQAQQRLSLIRDVEIERYMHEWFSPILRAAGLTDHSVDIILVNDSTLNAYVAGGSNVFFHTGLLTETDNVGEVIGVFSHELGHITGGHLIRGREAANQAGIQALATTLIGLGAAIASGSGQAAGAAITAGQAMGANHFLSHSRVQESSADQAALSFMQDAHLNPQGFRSFLVKLEDQELLPAGQQVEYVRTHPLTTNRIESVSARIDASPYVDKELPAAWQEQHARMKAKLIGFITPDRVKYIYKENDKSIAADYARAIAAYRQSNFDEAKLALEGLLKQEPKNPYFAELLGQVYRDSGDINEAIKYFNQADQNLEKPSALIKTGLAHVWLEKDRTNSSAYQAIKYLKQALNLDDKTSSVYRLLATAYGRVGQDGLAKLYLAEEGLLRGDYDYARRQVEAASRDIKQDSPDYLKAQDLLLVIKQRQEKKDG
ncbi:MAG: peptidase M48 family protein [Micavibrio sp.]|nr:peptidase M48 family protein [Micavibrio sp.]|tara:strand:- start:154 stop:1506 length:1353 start_codon:yes stop_codon:yes gene_type:complete